MPHQELVPRLELVETGRIRFHEHPERRRTLRLKARLEADGRLRNPPVVAEIGERDHLLLDGANRVSAFRELGLSHVPVQVVDYGDHAIALKSWHHLLVEAGGLDLGAALRALPGVEARPVAAPSLERLLELRQVYAVWVDESARAVGLFPGPERRGIDVRDRIERVTGIIGCYEGKSALERVKLARYDDLPAVLRDVDHQLCLYPSLTKEELLGLVREEIMIPTGITRHLIPGRALGLNLDLGFLTGMRDDAAKHEHFRAHVSRIEVEGRIRYYEEPVFIMNE